MTVENPKKLGFGLMRLPKRGVGIDIKQTSQMVDLFMEAGCTYFDTAHVYLGSEEAARKALVERYPRESYTLATKLYAPMAPTRRSAQKQFETSLKRTGAGYIDYYLLHSLMGNNVGKYERMQLWDYVADLKARGLVRHVGFSVHDVPELLDRLLNEHPEVEFVQLQINYEDWENPRVTSRANYEVARAHDKKIVIMEPVKGGRLANPPAKVCELLRTHNSQASFATDMSAMDPEVGHNLPFDMYREGYEYYVESHAHPNSHSRFAQRDLMDLFAWDPDDFMYLIDQPLLMVVGEKADTAYMSESAFEVATGTEDKELYVVAGAAHVDLYWRPGATDDAIAKLASFFRDRV